MEDTNFSIKVLLNNSMPDIKSRECARCGLLCITKKMPSACPYEGHLTWLATQLLGSKSLI